MKGTLCHCATHDNADMVTLTKMIPLFLEFSIKPKRSKSKNKNSGIILVDITMAILFYETISPLN